MTAATAGGVDIWRRARRVLLDPRAVGVMQAGPRTVAFLARGRYRGGDDQPAGPAIGPSFGLAAQVLLDEVLIAALRNPKLFPRDEDYERAGQEISAAHDLWEQRGWLADPGSYHDTPGAPADWSIRTDTTFNQRYETLTYLSGYEPRAEEPGADRWMARRANRTAHAYIARTHRLDRPWLICVHGFGTGRAALDLRAFRSRHLTRTLGMNLLLPVLPMHGPRQEEGADAGEGFMTINLLDSVHGLAQSAWDIRAAIRWIRSRHGDVPVGIYGISLGAYVAALTASLETELACVITGVPAVDIADLYRRHSPRGVRRRAVEAGALGECADGVTSVVSPLALSPKVAAERRYIFGGVGDRMANFEQAERLWRHWGRPNLARYPGGHIGFYWAAGLRDFVDRALVESGLADLARATSSSRAPGMASAISGRPGTSSRQEMNPKPTDSM
ncbi:MAG TPA: alpha/beta hydrolase [Acidimicrobiales bacterium]|nr:alpha/beta hydrolase [Acidimicrobiales bacterium]